jgi:ribosomal protein S18 acetylase RimI-like enzyme
VEIRRVTSVDEVVAAEHLYDGPARRDWAATFLDSPGHHLLLAYDGDTAVGMVTGVEMTMPDKGTEMFVYELGVDEPHRRQGIARALVTALTDLAAARGCYGLWVLTDHDNVAARATYQGMPGAAAPSSVGSPTADQSVTELLLRVRTPRRARPVLVRSTKPGCEAPRTAVHRPPRPLLVM